MRRIACLCATACFLTAVVGGTGASAAPDGSPAAAAVTSPALLALITNNDLFSVANLTTVLAPLGMTRHPALRPVSVDLGRFGHLRQRLGAGHLRPSLHRATERRRHLHSCRAVQERQLRHQGRGQPGACETNPGGTIVAGKTGSMHGYFIIPNVERRPRAARTATRGASTNANCTTATFIDTHFTPCYLSTCTVTTFFDHYAAGDQGLFFHEWKNASPDRGGDAGDIASS